ncbi:MAG: hypothetical protein PUF75_09640, partial [Coprococcus sp.]|nr:hypothetical protein [Coprococcus sp.]
MAEMLYPDFLWLNLFSVRISITIKLGETEAIYKAKICMLFCSIGKGDGTWITKLYIPPRLLIRKHSM